jgi:uncharacterized protein YjbJ (UPF0337 family)
MDENQVEGVIREGVGRLQDGVGGVAGDTKTQLKGKANEVAGAAQRTFGDIKDKAGDLAGSAGAKAQDLYGAADQFARQQPLASVGIGVLVGFGLGVLLGAQVLGQTRTVYFRR